MKIMTWESLFGSITGKQNKHRTLANAKWQTLPEHTWFNGYEYAAGSQYKYWEGRDFGYVCFHKDSKCPDGKSVPGRFLHSF